MKSSRLSPAGRLQGGACMLGSRLEGSGCASCSSVRPLQGRKEEGNAQLGSGHLCPLGSTLGWGRRGQLWEGVRPAGWELRDPGNRLLWAPAFRLPVLAPRGTMGCLLGRGQELRVGAGEGEARRGGGEAGQEWACWTKLWAHTRARWPAPLGLSLHSAACSPRGKAEGTGAAGRGGPGHSGLCFSSPCLLQSLCEHLLASRHHKFLGLWERPQ